MDSKALKKTSENLDGESQLRRLAIRLFILVWQ